MMKNKGIKGMKISILLMALLVLLTGCNSGKTSTELTNGPMNRKLTINGTWFIESIDVNSSQGTSLTEEMEAMLGKEVQFAQNFVQIGSFLLQSPKYKTKIVDSEKYLLFGHKSLNEDTVLRKGPIQVVTIYSEDRNFCDVLKLSEEKAIIFVDNVNLNIRFQSEETSVVKTVTTLVNNSSNGLFFNSRQDGTGKSGVLLGLRDMEILEGGGASYTYRTLWISSNNKVLNETKERNDIFYPRRNGFWKIIAGETGLYTCPVLLKENGSMMCSRATDASENHIVDFVCNDYISVRIEDKVGSRPERRRVLTIDNLPDSTGVSATELLGYSGIKAVQDGVAKAMTQHGLVSGQAEMDEESLRNFGVERKMGHWLLMGRLSYNVKGSEFMADYPLNIIPPTALIFYDDAKVAWTDIKDNVPEALDAFTSPNGDIALIMTKRSILVYGIEKGKLDLMPLKRIPLKDNEKPIMAEWATGKYLSSWNAAFDK